MTTTPTRSRTSARPLAALAAAALALAACSSSGSSTTSAAQSQLATIKSATVQGSTSRSAPTGPTIDLAAVDVCRLLTPAEANAAAHAAQFDGLQDASTVYQLTATRQPGPDPSCRFALTDGVVDGSAVVRVQSAKSFHVRPYDTRTTGLGDEAYDDGTDPVVRVGTVMFTESNNSFPDSITVALLRMMIPKLK